MDGSTDGGLTVNRTAHQGRLKEMSILFQEIQDRLDRAYEKSGRTYNLRRRDVTYIPGQVVWCGAAGPTPFGWCRVFFKEADTEVLQV